MKPQNHFLYTPLWYIWMHRIHFKTFYIVLATSFIRLTCIGASFFFSACMASLYLFLFCMHGLPPQITAFEGCKASHNALRSPESNYVLHLHPTIKMLWLCSANSVVYFFPLLQSSSCTCSNKMKLLFSF